LSGSKTATLYEKNIPYIVTFKLASLLNINCSDSDDPIEDNPNHNDSNIYTGALS
jgi:hypothetical protein